MVCRAGRPCPSLRARDTLFSAVLRVPPARRPPGQPALRGLVAEAYDVWNPVDAELPDDAVHEAVVREGGGPALEALVRDGAAAAALPR